MTTTEIAKDLIALCNAGKNMEAIEKYYDKKIVSLEKQEPMKETKGIEGVKGKNQWWIDNHTVHGGSARGGWSNEDQFMVEFNYDITPKETGKRVQMNEVGLFTVAKGKIVKEVFFY